MYSIFPILFTFAVVFSIPVWNARAHAGALQNSQLSLNESVREALGKNPAIQSARETWTAMRARVPQAKAWDDPKISYQQALDRFVSVSRNSFADEMLSAEETIPVSGKNLTRGRVADADALLAYEQLRRQELDVISEVASTYFRLVDAYAQIDLNRKSLASLKEIEESAQSKYGAGGQGSMFVLTAQIEYSKLLEASRDLDLELARQQSKMNVLLGRDAFATIGKPAGVPAISILPSLETLRQRTLHSRPEVLMAEAKVQQQRALLQLAHRAWIPDPAISVQGQRYNRGSQGISEVDAGISLNLPWVNGHKYSAGVSEAAANVAAAEADLQHTKDEAAGMLREALEKVNTSYHEFELFRDKLIPQAQQAFDASQLAYEAGTLNFNDWIAAQRSSRDLEATERQHFTDYETAFVELEAAVGCPLRSLSPCKEIIP